MACECLKPIVKNFVEVFKIIPVELKKYTMVFESFGGNEVNIEIYRDKRFCIDLAEDYFTIGLDGKFKNFKYGKDGLIEEKLLFSLKVEIKEVFG